MASLQQPSGIKLFIEKPIATPEEVSPSPQIAIGNDLKGEAKEEAQPIPLSNVGEYSTCKTKEEPRKKLAKSSSGDIKKQLLNKWLEDCQRIISLTIAFVNSEITKPPSPQERGLLDKMRHDIGMTQSAIKFVSTYDVHSYASKAEAEAKLMEAIMLIRVQVRGMLDVLISRGCNNKEIHALYGRRCDCFDLANSFAPGKETAGKP